MEKINQEYKEACEALSAPAPVIPAPENNQEPAQTLALVHIPKNNTVEIKNFEPKKINKYRRAVLLLIIIFLAAVITSIFFAFLAPALLVYVAALPFAILSAAPVLIILFLALPPLTIALIFSPVICAPIAYNHLKKII